PSVRSSSPRMTIAVPGRTPSSASSLPTERRPATSTVRRWGWRCTRIGSRVPRGLRTDKPARCCGNFLRPPSPRTVIIFTKTRCASTRGPRSSERPDGGGEERKDRREIRRRGAEEAYVPRLRRREPGGAVHRAWPARFLLGVREDLRLHQAHSLS